ncbi:regulatory protein, luxR family [Amycolatopsis arida]|uniref:Regulatory protein, luxR family n=1 Tax=Amycolatopsis arida TaxID=587909 RepID=A0A1I5SFW7_9PSEU|nr:helix-turn-helix transcriptional regulator [Amycolatopsis arida]TDX96488.1 regulatory LuxR family protein [Amycolatopsis arida]SFP69602.1 regulatory protein, luxR family [Amycolatopsis arida]
MKQPTATPTDLVLDEPTRRLAAAVATGRLAPARLAVVAPGGYGKSAFLAHLERECVRVGTPVARFRQGAEPAAVVLVDDAHDLGERELAGLAELAADERTGLVIAARTWPRSAALNAMLGGLRGQVVLRPLDAGQIAELVPARLAEFVHAQTGGVPGLVRILAGALTGRTEREVPAAALAELRHELDRADTDTLRVLLAADVGAGRDVDLLAGLLETPPERAVEAARATGLLTQDGTLLPIGSRALRALVPASRRHAVCRRLAELRLRRGGRVLPLVRPLLDVGLGGPEVAATFRAGAEEAAAGDPALAARLLDAAVAAGLPAAEVGAWRAELAARAGDLDTALRLADEVIAAPEAPERSAGARVAGVALAHRGQLARSAELFRWAGSAPAFAAIGLLGTGRPAEAGAVLDAAPGDAPPTLLSGAMSAAARGLLDSVTGSPTLALSTLASSAEMLEPVGRGVLLPDSPAALGAVVAIHDGQLAIAESLVERALAAGVGGALLAARHRLLLAWAAMVRGDLETATARLRAAGQPTAPRDWLFAVGLRVGLARRASDVGGLRRIWGQACEAVIRHPVDLFTLLPFGELAVAAARLGDHDRLVPHLRRVRELLTALDEPPLWTTPVWWSALHSAIVAERPEEAAEAAEALGVGGGSYRATLAAAARCWVRVMGGKVERDEVEAAARGLHDAGLCWDGARLAGQAAIRTRDRAAMVALLDTARGLQGEGAAPRVEPAAPGGGRLSERELQVAELVVAGMTYKQVGDRLFISAKTVEHHMARMRQRLGARNRAELLAQLRALLGK